MDEGIGARELKPQNIGTLSDGQLVQAITLANDRGMRATVCTYGAMLQSLVAPDGHGRCAEITLGLDSFDAYVARRSFLGVTVGRYANRIAKAQFVLDDEVFQLDPNEGAHCLHGGRDGFDSRNWAIASITNDQVPSVTLTLTSPDGDMGFPGTVEAQVTYSLDAGGDLTIAFTATTDKPTVINLTNHAYFNLADVSADLAGHEIEIPASRYLPVDNEGIPAGGFRDVRDTHFDLRNSRALAGAPYDHNFVLDKGATDTPGLAARLSHPASGRVLEVLTTAPGLQLYTGNPGGIALEPQLFPDTPNQPTFCSARVNPGETYRHTMIYRLSVSE